MEITRPINRWFMSDLQTINQDVRDRFEKLHRRVRKNEVMSGFYESAWEDMTQEYFDFYGRCTTEDHSLIRMMDRYANHVYRSIYDLKSCCRFFEVDYYRFQGVKDIKRTYSCSSKFCDGCQAKISQQRFERFKPILDSLLPNFDVAHVVFTVPNVPLDELNYTLDRMFLAFPHLIRFLKGAKFVSGVDFVKYGYSGCVRSLELVREPDGLYHPHFHCVFIFEKKSGVFKVGKHINDYSFSSSAPGKIRLFNDFTILMQKVWYLLINGVVVNKSNIDDLRQGYDVFCERRNDFKEVFKYATKGVLKWSQDLHEVLGSCHDFLTLDRILYGRRLIQAYGCLRGVQIADEVDQTSDQDEFYNALVEKLRSLEKPIQQRELLDNILKEMHDYKAMKYISCKNVKSFIGAEEV